MTPVLNRLAVCSWSLQPESPQHLADALGQIGISRVQIALDVLRENRAWQNFGDFARRNGIQPVSGMFGTLGEDYTTMESIKLTGGVVPDPMWSQNWIYIQENAQIAAELGLKLVTFHAGFLPHDEKDRDFSKLLKRISEIADCYSSKGIQLGFETGQESADTLKLFLEKLNRKDVGVNFDPANMILYEKGDPIEALKALSPWLKQCHIKDAIKTKVTGTWGEEVPVGSGQVSWPGFLEALDEIGYNGDLAIEREAGTQRIVDIRKAREVLVGIAGN